MLDVASVDWNQRVKRGLLTFNFSSHSIISVSKLGEAWPLMSFLDQCGLENLRLCYVNILKLWERARVL